jgi:7-cyano-7-deazaguanine reductase
MKKSSYENLQKHIRGLKTPRIEVWENQYPDKRFAVHIEIPEFTCICPKTGLPDFAVILVDYVPAKVCIELKSFKEYMVFYRNVGIFHEHFANKLMDDFVKAARPRWAKIVTRFNPRGGITTVVTREYQGK